MTRIPVTLFTSAIMGILLVVLSLLVSTTRGKVKVPIGDGAGKPGAEALLQAIRAQGNFIEYVPMALILLGATEASGATRLGSEIFAFLLILARISHAIGMREPGANPLRAAGALLTYLVLLGLSVEALLLLP